LEAVRVLSWPNVRVAGGRPAGCFGGQEFALWLMKKATDETRIILHKAVTILVPPSARQAATILVPTVLRGNARPDAPRHEAVQGRIVTQTVKIGVPTEDHDES
jgi:hypothetical protein